jgi:peptide/nickel transport system ATP-binding protein
MLGIVGESGCGKSTLGRIILHLLEPTSGTITFDGQDITNPSKVELKALRKNMQMVFQDPYTSLNPRMSISETIGEPLVIHKTCTNKAEYKAKVKELMTTVGLASRYEMAYPHELDGGRRQRVGIARALALDPQFIVFDEPVSALDVSIQARILNLIQEMQKERNLTCIFITHDLSVVKHISDDIMVMYLGVCVERASTKELFRNQYHPYTKALISVIPKVNPDSRRERLLLQGEITSPINPPFYCRFAARCGYVTEECLKISANLDELTENHFVACPFAKKINNL